MLLLCRTLFRHNSTASLQLPRFQTYQVLMMQTAFLPAQTTRPIQLDHLLGHASLKGAVVSFVLGWNDG